MALTKIQRNRTPLDGSWFCTTANLNSLLNAIEEHSGPRPDDSIWPSMLHEIQVPTWISMRPYKAQETPENPSGMIHGPVVKIGTMESPEIKMFGMHWRAGLDTDYRLDWAGGPNKWIYRPYGYHDRTPPGEDVSVYQCSKCKEHLYRDNLGERSHYSACIFDGGLVCRDCDVTGLVYDGETGEQLARARDLADRIGHDVRLRLERDIETLNRGFGWGQRAQTRLYREDSFSFNWNTVILADDGTRKRGINGGLIQHGPSPHRLNKESQYKFKTWDYKEKKKREATPEEVSSIHWSIHT